MNRFQKLGLVLLTIFLNLPSRADVTVSITTHNLSGETMTGLELYISAYGCSAGFFACYTGSGASIPPGGSSTCGGNVSGAYGASVSICQATYSDGSLVPNQQWTGGGASVTIPSSGTVNWDVWLWGGEGGGSAPTTAPPPPPPDTCKTNVANWTGCMTIANPGSTPQYYQFHITTGGCKPYDVVLPPCGGLSIDGQTPQCCDDTWFVCGPGETHTVCAVNVPITNVTGCTGCSATAGASFYAVSPSQTFTTCGLSLCPNFIGLCNDGLPYAGGTTPVGQPVSLNSANNTASSGGITNTNSPSGIQYPGSTSNILWSADTNDPAQNLTMQQGFSALYDAAGHQLQELNKIDQDIINSANSVANAISNSRSTVTISNLVLTNINTGPTNVAPGSNYVLNWPTNYPDAAAIGALGVTASNTAAPLAYTNLGIEAYSTNPSDVVSYASNTLAAPVNATMLEYSQSASTAAQAITVGGSPGSLLTINFSVPGIGDYAIDCNPMDNADIADFAGWFRSVMEWVVGLGFIGLVLRDGATATHSALQTPQGQFPKLTVLGNSFGWPLAAVYIVAIVAAMAAVPFALVTWFSVGQTGQMWWQQIALNPFSGEGAGRAVALSLWLADQFFPMSYMVSSAIYYIAFRLALTGVVSVAATIVRALMA